MVFYYFRPVFTKPMRKLPFILIIVISLGACREEFSQNDAPVAKVLDKYLFKSEVVAFIPPGTPKQDSILLAQNYLRNWITQQLLLNKAVQNLSDDEKNIRKQVEEYASSILIHKYKNKLISQKLDIEVSERDIDRYYDENKLNFILSHAVVRAQLIIIPKQASNVDSFRKWFLSNDPKDQEVLEEYCITNAKKYDNFNNKWIELRYLLNLLPLSQKEWEEKYKNSTHIEVEDEDNYYFMKIHEMFNERDVAPSGYVKQEIELILRNKIKIEFEENLERQINEEGVHKKYVTIYD